jgi:hypothetical protein
MGPPAPDRTFIVVLGLVVAAVAGALLALGHGWSAPLVHVTAFALTGTGLYLRPRTDERSVRDKDHCPL